MEETYIILKVSQNINDSYYKVYVDENEDPYINIRVFLTDYLGFSDVKCDLLKLYCESKMPPNETLFWLDGRHGDFGNAESPGSEKFDKSSIVVINKEMWVKYDVVAKWIPLEGDWQLDAYILKMNPKFKLIFDKQVERQEMLKKLKAVQMQKESEQRREVIYPDHDFNAIARYRWGLSGGTKSMSSTSFDYDVTMDVLTGTVKTGQSFTFPFSNKRTIGTPYGTYTLKDKKYFHIMEVGTTNFDVSPLLMTGVQTDYAFKLDSIDRSQQREGNINITDLAPKGTEVDLYVDGYYTATASVGDDGKYSFPEVIANSSSSVVLKIYYPNGLEEEKKINISRDGGNRLAKGDFEERIYVGKVKASDSIFYFTSLRYGLLHNLTLGISPMLLPEEEHVSPMFDFYFMPFYWINFFSQSMISAAGFDRAFDINIGLLEPSFIQIEHRYYNPTSPFVLGMSSSREAGEYWSAKHQVNFSQWSLSETYEQTTKQRKISASVRKPLTKLTRASVSGNTNIYRNSNVVSYSIETSLDFDLYTNNRLGISRNWSSGVSQNQISYDLRDTNEIGGFDVKARFDFTDSGDKRFSTEVTYRATENIKLTVSLQNQYLSGTFYWNGVIGGSNSPDLWDKYDYGTVSGRVLDTREKGPDGKGLPVSGVVIQVGTESGTTDDNGDYRISNIPVESVVTARVDANSIDGTLAPEHEKEFMYFRKASYINWCPRLFPTIGLDGYIDANGGVREGVKIDAIRLSDYALVASSTVEPEDGFFLLEKLTPGRYQLSLNWPGKKIKPIEVNIKKNAEWITGVRWDIDESTFEFAKGDQAAETKVLEHEIVTKSGASKDPVPVKIIATKDVDMVNKLKGLENIVQIKIHSAEISNDESSKKRIETYKKILVIIGKIEKDWANISDQKKEESIMKIKKLITSKNLTQDEINVELLRKIRLEISNRIEKIKTRSTSVNAKKINIYTRLDKIIDNLQKEWDRLSLDERATKIEGIKKIFKGLEK